MHVHTRLIYHFHTWKIGIFFRFRKKIFKFLIKNKIRKLKTPHNWFLIVVRLIIRCLLKLTEKLNHAIIADFSAKKVWENTFYGHQHFKELLKLYTQNFLKILRADFEKKKRSKFHPLWDTASAIYRGILWDSCWGA